MQHIRYALHWYNDFILNFACKCLIIISLINWSVCCLCQESQVGGNESMKAMPAPPQEETIKKDSLNKYR